MTNMTGNMYRRGFGEAPQWDDLRFPASAVRINPVTSKPDTESWISIANGRAIDITILAFDGALEEAVRFTAQLPHGYMYGTQLEFHVHWCPLAAPVVGQTVRWGLDYVMAQHGEVFGGGIGHPSTLDPVAHTFVAGDVENQHIRTSLGNIDTSAWNSLSGIIEGRLFRDAPNDTWAGEAGFHEADFHFRIDQIGSRQELVK